VHDIADFESRGIPAVFVASSEFVQAAETQATSLGLAVKRVFVPHPIQDRTDAEMAAYADQFYAEIVSAITESAEPPPS
jgi:hypothetical protein